MNAIEEGPHYPEPRGVFEGDEAIRLLFAYQKDPSSIDCPTCGEGYIEVVGFVDPTNVAKDGSAPKVQPEGTYAAALFCWGCHRSVGVLAGVDSTEGR